MISAGETRRINIPTYLQVLGQLPNVSSGDIEATKEVLQEALDNPELGTVRFARAENANGVEVVQVYRALGHADIRAMIAFDMSGKVYCQARNLNETLPLSIAPYFVGGIFGTEEGDAVVLKKIEGVRDLYRCAIQKGGVKNCGWFDGAAKLEEAEKIESDQNRRTAEEIQQKAETIWRSAEEMRENARGWGDGDPDDIQKVMNSYSVYRFNNGGKSEAENAKIRLEKAEAMMKEIGESAGGWPQFEKKFCETSITGTGPCNWNQSGSVTHYHLSCSFGVRDEDYSSSNCEDRFKRDRQGEGITPGDRAGHYSH